MVNEPTSGGDRSWSRRRVLLGATGAMLSGLAGCLAQGKDSGLSGEIRVDGSNTVLPHSAVVAEEFQWRNNRVEIPVQGSGTGAGFQQFCEGSTHIQNASREIGEGEQRICDDNGVNFIGIETALDGIGLIVHPDNHWCDSLTVEELNEIWQSGSAVETWQDVRSGWPDEEIDLYGRDPASGTFDYFTEQINGEVGNTRSDYSASADTNVIVRGVRGSRYSLGYGGVGYYYENEDDLKLLAVDNGDGPVIPDRETIESGEYQPLTRALYTYFRTDAFAREEVREFAEFYFEEIDDEAREAEIVEDGETLVWTQWAARRVGFYGLPDESPDADEPSIERSKAALDTAIDEVRR